MVNRILRAKTITIQAVKPVKNTTSFAESKEMRKPLHIIASALIALSCSNSVDDSREVGRVTGRVLFEDTESTIPKVEVKLGDYSFTTVTNGKFSFTVVSNGVYPISAFKAGYHVHTDSLIVSGPTDYEIRLYRVGSPR